LINNTQKYKTKKVTKSHKKTWKNRSLVRFSKFLSFY